MRPVFKWSGAPFGFIHGGALFGYDGRYVGWIARDGKVWHGDGRYIGDLVDEEYVLRNTQRLDPPPAVSRVSPVSPTPPAMPASRMPRPPRPGWIDALD